MDSCNVCGGTDMNLVDGFYYCVECGTQDVNVRETIVEQTIVADGTFAYANNRKIKTVVKDTIEMSSEWHKWHIFNFILVGLTDELIALGAKPTFKMKVLWIWSRYIKQFQVKDDLQSKSRLDIGGDDEMLEDKANVGNDKENIINDDLDRESGNRKSSKSKLDKILRSMNTITKGAILTILYVALNLDRSDIQLSHLFRFIREGRLSLYDCMKYVPKELKLNGVNNWKSFVLSLLEYNPISIRKLSMTYFKILKLGVPLVPDLRKLVRNLVQELCLPNEIKDLVFALMHFMPIEFLHVDAETQKGLVKIPDYEGVCMAYILVALKICFGLDDEYELKLSNEVDKINVEENYLKSYKLGLFSEPCDRLFSFREWCQHLQFRKYVLCKNYLPMSKQFNNQTDDYTFMEHVEKRKKREVKLRDDVTMDILGKVKLDEQSHHVIPKADFPVTLTPMSTYIDVIAQGVQDPDLRLLLSEDFSQYSLKYATTDLSFYGYLTSLENPIVGVCESGKIFNKFIIGTLTVQEGDMSMVYVRDCQNKNWLQTKPPNLHHITKNGQNENNSDKESDHGYDSNVENSTSDNVITHITNCDDTIYKDDKVLETIDDLDVNKCIFDDNLMDIPKVANNIDMSIVKEDPVNNFFEISGQSNLNVQDIKVNWSDNDENDQEGEMSLMQFNPDVFHRDNMIKELVELACKTYKISIPKKNLENKQYKRKKVADNTSSSEPKKSRPNNRSNSGEVKRVVGNLISAYYDSLHTDIFKEVSEQVKSIIEIEGLDNQHGLESSDVLDNQNSLNESSIMNTQNSLRNVDIPNIERQENEISLADINTTGIKNNQTVIHCDELMQEEENVEDETLNDVFFQSDPKFDEKEHDIRQLYMKLGENTNVPNVSISDISNNPEIDKIIKKQIEQYSNNRSSTLNNYRKDIVIDEVDNVNDSDDDIPLSIFKDTNCYEQEKKGRKKEKLDTLIRDPSSVKAFNYWVRHYKSAYARKCRDAGKKFDLELIENLPVSFVFVIRECAAILGCSMFSLYKHMQNIEEILIANL